MTRLFKRWISLLLCLFLPTMMISYLYHKHEMLQRKIDNTLQIHQRLYPKSFEPDESSRSIWETIVIPTPIYRVERDLNVLWSPTAISRLTSKEVKRVSPTTKKMVTKTVAKEDNPLQIREEELVDGPERSVIVAIGNDVIRTKRPSKVTKKRPSRRPRRSNKIPHVKQKELHEKNAAETPVESVRGLEKVDANGEVTQTFAPVAKIPHVDNHEEDLKEPPVKSFDTVRTALPTTKILQTIAQTKIITEVPNFPDANLTNKVTNFPHDNKMTNETKYSGLTKRPVQEKPSEQKVHTAPAAPSKRKSNKKKVKVKKPSAAIVDQVVNKEQKLNLSIPDSEVEKSKNETKTKDSVDLTMDEQKENSVPEKPLSKKESSKKKRDRKSKKSKRKSHSDDLSAVPVTLPLKFNLTDPKTHSPVILASTNKAFMNFTDNWLESVKRSGIRSGVTLVAEDREAFNYLNNRTDIELNVVLNDVSESPGERLQFDSPAYKQLVNKRPSYILQILSSGHDVLFSDVDIVWLKNPLPFFTNDTNDIWLQEDRHEPTVYCAGFTFYRSTPATIALVTEWVQTLALHPTYPDQRVLNGLLRKKRWQGDAIKKAVMDSRLFPSGHLFFDPEWREANKDSEQVMVHNNWIVGHDRKVERFKDEGFWYL
nr:uncharacterized protein LOC129257510 [Lytechinus pictus]